MSCNSTLLVLWEIPLISRLLNSNLVIHKMTWLSWLGLVTSWRTCFSDHSWKYQGVFLARYVGRQGKARACMRAGCVPSSIILLNGNLSSTITCCKCDSNLCIKQIFLIKLTDLYLGKLHLFLLVGCFWKRNLLPSHTQTTTHLPAHWGTHFIFITSPEVCKSNGVFIWWTKWISPPFCVKRWWLSGI